MLEPGRQLASDQHPGGKAMSLCQTVNIARKAFHHRGAQADRLQSIQASSRRNDDEGFAAFQLDGRVHALADSARSRLNS